MRTVSAWVSRQPRIHREVALLVLLCAVAVGAFLGTRILATSNAHLRRHDSDVWLTRGADALERGDIATAVAALRRASQVDRTNDAVEVRLASALEQSGDAAAAETVLFDRRTRNPDDADVNMALARLEARQGRVPDAVRYYQTALDALWSDDQAETSRQLRQELIDLLLAHGQRAPALSQVLVLAASAPADPASQVRIGWLFLRAGDARRAFDRFANALAGDPRNHDALAGAGEAAFAQHDYAAARKHLSEAGPLDPAQRTDLDIATIVVTTDPLAVRLSSADRVSRLNQLLALARDAVDACRATNADVEGLRTSMAAVTSTPPKPSAQADERDWLEDGVALAGRAARVAAACGAPSTSGIVAASLIAALHGFTEPQ